MMSQPASYRIQTKKFGRSQTLRPNFAPIDDEWLYYLLLDPFVAGVPEVPVDCPGVAAPGALYVPEVVGDPGAEDAPEDELLDDLSEVTPDEEPELMLPELDFFAPESMAPQAPSAKTHAIGMIHLFIKSSLKNLNEESSGTHHIRAETLCLH